MNEIQMLRQEVAELRLEIVRMRQHMLKLGEEIVEADAWALGIFLAVRKAFPYLLRNHPDAAKVGELLKISTDRFHELERHPERAEENERQEIYEAVNMIYNHCALMGAFPDVDPDKFQKKLVRQFRRQYNID